MKQFGKYVPFLMFFMALTFNSCSEDDIANDNSKFQQSHLTKSNNIYEVIKTNLYNNLLASENLDYKSIPTNEAISNDVFELFETSLYESSPEVATVYNQEMVTFLSEQEIENMNISELEKEFLTKTLDYYNRDDLDGFMLYFDTEKENFLNAISNSNEQLEERFMPVIAAFDGIYDYYTLRVYQKDNCADRAVKGAAWGALFGAAQGFVRGCITGAFLGFNPGSVAAGCMGGMIVGMVRGAVVGAVEEGVRCELGG
jgi:hypothetical protein|tara:strand:+ start:61899 stop:62669 length:771 start_codon:yes stop_codon:yes gene_type:complete